MRPKDATSQRTSPRLSTTTGAAQNGPSLAHKGNPANKQEAALEVDHSSWKLGTNNAQGSASWMSVPVCRIRESYLIFLRARAADPPPPFETSGCERYRSTMKIAPVSCMIVECSLLLDEQTGGLSLLQIPPVQFQQTTGRALLA